MESFWKVVHKRVLEETRDALKLKHIIIGIIVPYCIYVGFVWYFSGGEDLAKDVWKKVLLMLAPFFVFPFLYVYKYLTLPTKMWNETQGRINELTEGRPRLKLSYGTGKTSNRGNHKMTMIDAISEGGGDVVDAQVIIHELWFMARGSNQWVRTSIIARHNMSWGRLEDGHPEKYASIQLSRGPEIVDFITSPAVDAQSNFVVDGQGRRAFMFRIHPNHIRTVFPIFFEHGTYRFVMQLSAPNVLDPPRLTLFVEWDGQAATIKSEDGQVLETV